jgi:hypothetical protein
VEDLGPSGAGLELGEWQGTVGFFVFALVLFTLLAVALSRAPFATGALVVCWITFVGVAAVAWFVYSAKGRTGVVNAFGRGLTYDAWWASVIPWIVTTALAALGAFASLVSALARFSSRKSR